MSNSQYERYNAEKRIMSLQLLVVCTVSLLITALVFFQIVRSDAYIDLASQNRLRILRKMPPRGNITGIPATAAPSLG